MNYLHRAAAGCRDVQTGLRCNEPPAPSMSLYNWTIQCVLNNFGPRFWLAARLLNIQHAPATLWQHILILMRRPKSQLLLVVRHLATTQCSCGPILLAEEYMYITYYTGWGSTCFTFCHLSCLYCNFTPFSLYIRHLLHICPSWKRDPFFSISSWGFFHFFPVKGFLGSFSLFVVRV